MRRANIERNILFLCEDNACLSQIAEASARHLAPPRTRVFSAGIKPAIIPQQVVQAMQELGISMGGQKAKSLEEVPMQEIDLVVSFGEAHKKCLNLPGRVRIEAWKCPTRPRKKAQRSANWKRFAPNATKSTSEFSRYFLITGAMFPSYVRCFRARRR